MRHKCCWNEEKKEWYSLITVGVQNVMCEGCNQTFDMEEFDNDI